MRKFTSLLYGLPDEIFTTTSAPKCIFFTRNTSITVILTVVLTV